MLDVFLEVRRTGCIPSTTGSGRNNAPCLHGCYSGGKRTLSCLQEFPARNREYYEEAFADGRLRVAGGRAGLHDPLRGGMQMQHYIHRHEPPVLDLEIPVSLTPALPSVSPFSRTVSMDRGFAWQNLTKACPHILTRRVLSKSRN